MLDALLLVSTVAFVIAGAAVGARLLLLSARTRELSDFLVGFSLFDLSAIGYPLILLGSLGDLSLPHTKLAAIASSIALALGWAGVFLFTQRVFRAGERQLHGRRVGLDCARHLVVAAALLGPRRTSA